MLEFTNLTHGQILNHTFGKETEDGLTIQVRGIARSGDKVEVNGQLAQRCGEEFLANVTLTKRFNYIVAISSGDRGRACRDITVLWDKKSFKRANIFIDDNSFFLTDIAKERPNSIFEHFYLKMLKRFHDEYGLKITLNLFFQNDHEHFQISQFPDCYKADFQNNADWLRLAWHAYSEFPDRPYQNALPEKIEADYDQIANEVERFAGPSVFIPPVVCHWAMMQPAGLQVLRKKGVRAICAPFIDAQTFIGEAISDIPVTDIGFFQSEENGRFLSQQGLRYDFRHELVFSRSPICCNLMEKPVLQAELDKMFAHPHCEATYALTHEQYFFPRYFNYLPDHAERMDLVLRQFKENGYQFVFFNDGFLGNTTPVPEH